MSLQEIAEWMQQTGAVLGLAEGIGLEYVTTQRDIAVALEARQIPTATAPSAIIASIPCLMAWVATFAAAIVLGKWRLLNELSALQNPQH